MRPIEELIPLVDRTKKSLMVSERKRASVCISLIKEARRKGEKRIEDRLRVIFKKMHTGEKYFHNKIYSDLNDLKNQLPKLENKK